MSYAASAAGRLDNWRRPSQQLVYLTTPEQEALAAQLEAEAVKLNATEGDPTKL